jgi:CTLH/CRA C-terminal to LisH motif domain
MLSEHFPSVLSGPIVEPPPRLSESPSPVLQTMGYMPLTSIDPAHLILNLRILSFIEACRTIPLVHPPPANEAAPSTPPTTFTDLSPERQLTLLLQVQKLHALINGLPNQSDRALYLKELQNVGGLLAYKVPETSSISKYLSQERREAVADQINSAILSA